MCICMCVGVTSNRVLNHLLLQRTDSFKRPMHNLSPRKTKPTTFKLNLFASYQLSSKSSLAKIFSLDVIYFYANILNINIL